MLSKIIWMDKLRLGRNIVGKSLQEIALFLFEFGYIDDIGSGLDGWNLLANVIFEDSKWK